MAEHGALPGGAAVHSWDRVACDAPMPMLTRRRVIGKQVMISHVKLERGCRVPTHAHENEQVSCLISGVIRFGIGAEGSADRRMVEVGPGEVVYLPSNVPHSAEAIEDCVVLDVFSPPSATTGIDAHGR